MPPGSLWKMGIVPGELASATSLALDHMWVTTPLLYIQGLGFITLGTDMRETIKNKETIKKIVIEIYKDEKE